MGTKSIEENCESGHDVWSWSHKEQQCVLTKGGCSESANVFEKKTECKQAAGICKFTDKDCQNGSKDKKKECESGDKAYSWDMKRRTCREVKGGCSASLNTFATRDACKEVARIICSTFRLEDCKIGTKGPGEHCEKGVYGFSWDYEQKKCIVTMAGCSKSRNRFKTKEKCKQATEMCSKADFDSKDCERGTQGEKDKDCKEGENMYRFDVYKYKCISALGGCSDTLNSFKNKTECMEIAEKYCTIFRKKDCLMGTKNEKEDCEEGEGVPGWKWDHSNKICTKAVVGCSSSRNRFTTEDECLSAANKQCYGKQIQTLDNLKDLDQSVLD